MSCTRLRFEPDLTPLPDTLFSFGIVMWECATRQLPFNHLATTWAIRSAVEDGERPPLLDDAPPGTRNQHDVYTFAKLALCSFDIHTQHLASHPRMSHSPRVCLPLAIRSHCFRVLLGYNGVMERCWSADPDARPTFSEVVQALESIATPEGQEFVREQAK